MKTREAGLVQKCSSTRSRREQDVYAFNGPGTAARTSLQPAPFVILRVLYIRCQ